MKHLYKHIRNLIGICLLATQWPLTAQIPTTNNFFQLQNVASSLVLSSNASGYIIPWTVIPNRPDFEWGFIKIPNSPRYYIINRTSGAFLDVNSNNEVVQNNFINGRTQQFWDITPLDNGIYTISNFTGKYLAMQTSTGSLAANGYALYMADNATGNAQRWQMINPDQNTFTIRVPEGTSTITVPYKNFNGISNTTYTIFGDSILVNQALTGKVSGNVTQTASSISFNVRPLTKGSTSNFLITLSSTNAASSGCIYQVRFNVVAVPNLVVWNPQSTDSNWNNDNNWLMADNNGNPTTTPTVAPLPTTTVVIPGNATNYPVLASIHTYTMQQRHTYTNDYGFTPQPICRAIKFRSGAEIGYPNYLVYNNAEIQMNFGYYPSGGNRVNASPNYSHMLDRNRWYLLSAPLKKVASGDYSFGGKPFTYMQYYDEINPETRTYQMGTWSMPFNSYAEELALGQGFALHINSHFNDPSFNIPPQLSQIPYNQTNMNYVSGVLTLPYYLSDDMNEKNAHSRHTYFNGASSFKYYDKSNPDNPGNKPADIFFRNTAEGSRFIAEDGANQFKTSFVLPYNASRQVLIGNPYMSHIDFSAFYADNQSGIFNYFRIWNGTTFYTCQLMPDGVTVATGTMNIDKYIPPMQSFLVQTKSNGASPTVNLNFNVNNISAVKPSAVMPLSKPLTNENPGQTGQLYISAQNDDNISETVIVCRAGATNLYNPDEDVFKLFTQYEEVPEIFTLTDGYAIEINHVNPEIQVIPLGILCNNYMNTTVLSFRGTDSFDGRPVYLNDKVKNKKIQLFENAEYPFTDTQKDISKRFELLFELSPNNLDNETENESIRIYVNQDRLHVSVPQDNQLVQIFIYNTQGQCINQFSNLNTNTFEKQLSLPSGNYLIKATTQKSAPKTEKITIAAY